MSPHDGEARLVRWLTVVSNVAVIVGLVFVGLQIRQNTLAVKGATVQELTSLSAQALAELASDSALAYLRLRGDADTLLLVTDVERFQYFAYSRGHWLRFQNAFLQWGLSVLDDDAWGTYHRIICVDFLRTGIRTSWPRHVEVLTLDFVELVESCGSE